MVLLLLLYDYTEGCLRYTRTPTLNYTEPSTTQGQGLDERVVFGGGRRNGGGIDDGDGGGGGGGDDVVVVVYFSFGPIII